MPEKRKEKQQQNGTNKAYKGSQMFDVAFEKLIDWPSSLESALFLPTFTHSLPILLEQVLHNRFVNPSIIVEVPRPRSPKECRKSPLFMTDSMYTVCYLSA